MRLTHPNSVCEAALSATPAGARAAQAPRAHRALLVTYLFPPTGGSGVQRAAKLAKYLPRFGWELDVLTAAHDRFPWRDESLLDDVRTAHAHRVEGYEPACVARRVASWLARLPGLNDKREWLEAGLQWRLARLTDGLGLGQGESLWSSAAVRQGIALCRTCKLEAVISTGPPHFVHQAARRIARGACLPWLADLRDPLVSDFDRRADDAGPRTTGSDRSNLSSPTRSRTSDLKAHGRVLERSILARADAITTTCTALAADLCMRYPQRWPDIACISNGFDPDDIAPHRHDVRKDPQVCRFVAAGAFYGRREIARLVQPLRSVLERNPQWSGRVRLAIAGTLDAEQRQRWERERPGWMELLGYLDHGAAVRLAAEAACAIVVVPRCEHGMLSVPGKTFELLALPTHVLGLVPAGSDAERILVETGAATAAAFEDARAVAEAMERIIRAHLAGTLETNRPPRAIERYDRSGIARQFAERLDRLVGERRSAAPWNTTAEGVTEVA